MTDLSSSASHSDDNLSTITKRGTLSNYTYSVYTELLSSGLKECVNKFYIQKRRIKHHYEIYTSKLHVSIITTRRC